MSTGEFVSLLIMMLAAGGIGAILGRVTAEPILRARIKTLDGEREAWRLKHGQQDAKLTAAIQDKIELQARLDRVVAAAAGKP
jgi:hypothetical protein